MRNKRFMDKVLVAGIFVSVAMPSTVWAEPVEADKQRKVQAKEAVKERHSDKKPPLVDMSSKDKEAMRKALQAVWEYPEVMQARDEVRRATETFRRAINKAVKQEDPRVAALMERINEGGKSKEWGKKRPGHEGRSGRPPMGRPPGPERGSGAGGDRRGIAPAGFMAFPGDFSEEEKMRLEQAREKAMESEAYKKLQQDLQILLKQGEGLRKKRVEMFHRTREAMARAMIEFDPEVKPLLERIENKKKER